MTAAITFVFISICLVEAFLIAREFRRTTTNTISRTLPEQDLTQTQILAERLAQTEAALEQSQKELQGIHVLWNKALQAEQKMRADLEVAKIQLTYLAQSLLKAKSDTKVYWQEAAHEMSQTAAPKTELRAFRSSAQLIEKDII